MILDLQTFDGFLSAVKEEENLNVVRQAVAYSRQDNYILVANIAYTARVNDDIIRYMETLQSEAITTEEAGKNFEETVTKLTDDYNAKLKAENIETKPGIWANA